MERCGKYSRDPHLSILLFENLRKRLCCSTFCFKNDLGHQDLQLPREPTQITFSEKHEKDKQAAGGASNNV